MEVSERTYGFGGSLAGLNTGYIDGLLAVDNDFIRQLAELSLDSAKQARIVSIVLKDKMSNRGEIVKKGVSAGDKSVVDLCKMTPLVGLWGAKNMFDEIATYRWNTLGLSSDVGVDFRSTKQTMFIDYLLSVCVCYVETFDSKASKVDKFFATRNKFLAGRTSGMSLDDTMKLSSHLSVYPSDYVKGHLSILKMTLSGDNSFKTSKPRTYLDTTKNIKVTPLFLITTFLDGIKDVLAQNIVRFRFIKDNITEREMVTTLSRQILTKYYDSDYALKVLSGVETKINRGYVKLPELGLSRYDDTGLRSLNVSRITSIEVIDSVDTRFIDVDFNNIIPFFKTTVENTNSVEVLAFIFEVLANEPLNKNHGGVAVIQNTINSFVDSQLAIGSTTFQRHLHVIMLKTPQIFKNYGSGKPKEYRGSSFNIGIGEE